MTVQPAPDTTGGPMSHISTCYLSVGSECRLTAERRPDGQVELRGMSEGGYPVLGMRIPRDAAIRLVAAILDALAPDDGHAYDRDEPTGDVPAGVELEPLGGRHG